MRVSPKTSARHLPKQWRVFAVAFIVVLGTLSPFMPGITPALADGVIFLTMSETTGQCDSWMVRSNVRYAHQFTAGGAATITSATNQLSSSQKYPSSTKVVIWSNVSSKPGAQLGSLTWQSTSAGNVASYSGSVSLSAGGTYWYEVQPTASIANHYYCTTASTSQTGSTSGWLQLKTLIASGSDSSSWTTFSGTAYQYPMFSLSGTVADTAAPTVSSFSSTTTNGSYKAAAAINITATASEAIQSGNTLTVTLDTGRTVLLTAVSAGTSLTGTYTVQAGDISSDLNVSSFTIGTVADTAGNAMTSTTVPTGASNIAGASAIIIDTTTPTVTLAAVAATSTSATITFTVTGNEPITCSTLSTVSGTDFTLTNISALTGIVQTSSTVCTVTAMSSASADGVAVVSTLTAAGSFSMTDTAGNAQTTLTSSPQSTTVTRTDTTAPTVTLAASAATSTSATITFTVTGNEAITCTTLSTVSGTDFTLTNISALTGIVQTSSTVCTVTATSSASADGVAVVSTLTAAGSFSMTDTAGNAQTTLTSSPQSTTVTIADATPPAATWTEPSTPSSSRTLSYSLVFNRSITGLTSGDFSNTGTATGCVATPSVGSGTTITVSVVCSSDGTVVVRLVANSVTASGNTGPITALSATSVTIDSVEPSATWTEPSTPSSSRTLAYTLVFNRSITGLTSSDFSYTGTATGCVATPSSSSGSSVTVSVVCSSDGSVVVRLAANSVTASGNTGPSAQLNATSVTIDSATLMTSNTVPGTTTTTMNTVPSTTTTTVATGQITVLTIAPVIASGSTTTTATTNPIRTTTTVVLIPVATVAPSVKPQKLAPIDIATITRGGAALNVAGKEVPVKISRMDNQLLISAVSFDATFSGLGADGKIIPLDSAGNIRLEKGDAVRITVTGFATKSSVEIRLYSDPILLGVPTVDDQGSLTTAYQIPDGLGAGDHRVVLFGKNYSGDKIVFTAGIVLGAEATTSWLTRILIAIPLLGAVLAGLLLPAILRRRKTLGMQYEPLTE